MTLPELRHLCAAEPELFDRLIESPLATATELGCEVSLDGFKQLLGIEGVADEDLFPELLRRLHPS